MDMKIRLLSCAILAGIWPPFQVSAAVFTIGDRTLTVPDGFEIEMIAGPPLVDRPIAADFDDEGRLYVSDSSGSNDDPRQQLQDKPHRVVRLTDLDGDGKFDKSTIFAPHMMFPEGALWYEGSLYVGAPPSIWKMTDTVGNGVADKSEEWMQAKTLTGCANDLHGPYAGPDGWIYWCKGAFAKQTYDRPGQEPFVTRAAHIFRCRPDGTGIEPVMTGGMDNPVGVAFTITGERILTSTFLQEPGGGKRDGLIQAIYGGVYGKVHDVIDEHPRTGHVLPVLSHLGPAAPCGITSYRSDVFGREYQDNVFVCCFNLHKVLRYELAPDGATYSAKQSDFLTSDDPDFHPTGVIEDADGSLVVLDTGGWYKLCCPTSQLAKPDVLGHIYRVRRVGVPKASDPRGNSIEWASLNAEELVKYLEDSRPAVRNRTIRMLAKLGDKAVGALSRVLQDSAGPEAQRNAVWALTRIDSIDARRAVRVALHEKDNTVRHIAVQSIGLWRDQDAMSDLLPMLQDDDAQVRRNAAEALGRIGNAAAVPALLNAAGQIDDTTVDLPASARILEHSITFALIEIADPVATAAGLQSGNARVCRVALIAMDQMRHGGLAAETVAPLLLSEKPVLKETASWIASRHGDWGGALAGFFRGQLDDPALKDAGGVVLQRQLMPFAREPVIEELLAAVLAGGHSSKPAKLVALEVMAEANLSPVPRPWLQRVAETLRSPDTDLVRESIAAARSFTLAKAGSPDIESALTEIGNDENAPEETRLEALAAAAPLENVASNLFSFLLANIDSSKPWPVRNHASSVLGKARLDHAQLITLAETLHGAGPAELTKLVDSFATSADETVGLKLVERLEGAKALSSLRVETIKPVIEKYPDSVQNKAKELFAMLGTDAAKQKEHLDQLMAELPKGDIRRGQVIFNNPKFVCIGCHTIGYLGGHVGPDLTSVGTIRTERDLLESIVYPSASFVRSYEPMIVLTKSGEDYNGVLRKDGSDEVVLATGPDTETHIPRSSIVEMRQGKVSIMPQGLETMFTRQELADLVAFLKDTKWGPR
jgi:putative membrane-bound dehydrogenase-like protein